jgi:hypothetical protein
MIFWLLVVAACDDQLLFSWRLMFMTFYGTSRAKRGDDTDTGMTTTGTTSP